jgi:dipeptidyl aminopeptidase/acylaminoacyl peptidase
LLIYLHAHDKRSKMAQLYSRAKSLTMLRLVAITMFSVLMLTACGNNSDGDETQSEIPAVSNDSLRYDGEVHLKNIRQLTTGGDNAEAYFNADGTMICFQRTTRDSLLPCDQIFFGKLPTTSQPFDFKMLSNGKGRTTCSYFLGEEILYASTHHLDDACPPEADRKKIGKYVWSLYDYDIFVANQQGEIIRQLTDQAGYDAEATVSPDGSTIVFTSTRSGDLELWTMKADGSDLKQVTHAKGYDGGAFFSPDGKQLIFRASRPESAEEIAEYEELLAQNLVAPADMELFLCNVDGSNLRQVTDLGGANWAPFMHPDGKRVIFASNHHTESGRQFNLFMINVDGTGLQQITFDEQFDSFPMFSPDGTQLIFSSNRNNGGTRDTNLFIADWVD